MLCICAGWAATAWYASRRNAVLAAARSEG